MTGQYEAYILVEVKDGRKFVCGMNRPIKPERPFNQLSDDEKKKFLDKYYIWN